jgi:hypothetical protein
VETGILKINSYAPMQQNANKKWMRAQPEPKFEDRTPPAKNFEKYKF